MSRALLPSIRPSGWLSLAGTVLALHLPGRAAAQEGAGLVPLPAATVPLAHPAYGALDELAALVPLRGFVVGQRPYSWREVARLTRSAERALAPEGGRGAGLDASAVARAGALVAQLRSALGEDAADASTLGTPADSARGASPAREASADTPRPRATRLRWHPLEGATAYALGSASSTRAVPRDNGLGTLDAVSNPPLDARFGRPALGGGALTLETAHAVGVGRWLAVVAQPRVSLLAPRAGEAGGTRVQIAPQRLAARAVLGNVALQAGLDERAWGQGGARSQFLSANAPPLRALSVGTDTAVGLPWVLRALGPLRAELFVADLGSGREFAHSKLAAYKVDVAPTAWLEVGAGLMSQFGGRGAPAMSLGERVRDLFPYVFWIVAEGSDPLASNKAANAQLRVRVPQWRSATVYWELAMDDFDLRRVRSMLWDDSGHLFGATLPRLRADGSLALDVQFHHTPLRVAQHYQFVSGLAYQRRTIGTPLGPNATAGYATLTWRPDVRTTWQLELAAERRDSSLYGNRVTRPDESDFGFVRLAPGVVEGRARAALHARREAFGAGRGWFVRAGMERVRNRAFRARAGELQPFAEGGVTVRF